MQNVLLFVSNVSLFSDFLVKLFKILFCQSIIREELAHLVIDVLLSLVSILELEFVDKHAL